MPVRESAPGDGWLMRQIGWIAGAVLAGGLGTASAAPLDEFVRVCGDPAAAPRDAARFCQRALDTGELPARAGAQVRVNLGAALYDLGRYPAAIEAYDAAIATVPELVPAYINRARALEKTGRVREAIEDYGRVLEMDPGEPDAYLGRGTLLLSRGRPAEAAQDFTQVIALRPGWVSAYFNRGLAALRTGDWAGAEQDFSTVLARQPGDAGAHLNRGRARAGSGQASALEDFDRAIELRPEWATAWFLRGQYLDAAGACEEANRDFLRAYDLGYADPWLVERVRNLTCG